MSILSEGSHISIDTTWGDQKVIMFDTSDVTIYYKLYRILRKRNNYNLKTIAVYDTAGRTILTGIGHIMNKIIHEISEKYRFTIATTNSDGDEIFHWRQETPGAIELLNNIRDKYIEKNDIRLHSNIRIIDNDTGGFVINKIDRVIEFLEYDNKETEVEEPIQKPVQEVKDDMTVYLDFNEVLDELSPIITNGTDQEKRDAKVILAYVAKKLAGA